MSTSIQIIEQIQEALKAAAIALSDMVQIESDNLSEHLTDGEPCDDKLLISDVLIQVNPILGELVIMNDDEQELSRKTINEWIDSSDTENFYNNIQPIVKKAINGLKCEMHRLKLVKPYSFVLIDDKKETIAELLLVDEDKIQIDGELMTDLEEDLNLFWEKLSKDF